MHDLPLIYVGEGAADRLAGFCREQGWRAVSLVADANTYAAIGRAVEQALAPNLAVRRILLEGPAVSADAEAVLEILLALRPDSEAILAAGSGTITDLSRFVAHRCGVPMISVPSAPSVDAFTSAGSALVAHGYKQTIQARPPVAIFADTPALSAAPRIMIQAGFADMVGKYTSLADWRLGRLLWDEPYDQGIADASAQALQRCVDAVDEIAVASAAGVQTPIQGLIDSGISMLRLGASHPASGGEHHMSHFWEMMLLIQGRPAVLHGLKVGLGSALSARFWSDIAGLSRQEVTALARRAGPPDVARESMALARVFGAAADRISASHAPFYALTPESYTAMLDRIVEAWDGVQEIAASVPSEGQIRALLAKAGAPFEAESLGLTASEVEHAAQLAHNLRNRFTILTLRWLLGIGRA